MAEASEKKWLPTVQQVSAGGVVFRSFEDGSEVAIIQTAEEKRWQLPKGLVDRGETVEEAAVREVREEAGVTADIIAPIDKIDYWFVSRWDGEPKRIHKVVHFFAMRYMTGDVADHDDEVAESRLVRVDEAVEMLEFKTEKEIVQKAAEIFRDRKDDFKNNA